MFKEFNPLSANFTRWSNTLKQFVGKLPKNCLSKRFVCKLPTSFFSVFDHFVGLALKGFSTYRTIKGAMVVNIKNIVHVCSNTLLSIFLRRDHSFPNNISYIDWQNWPIKPFTKRTLLKKYSEDSGATPWELNVEGCVWNSVLPLDLYGF